MRYNWNICVYKLKHLHTPPTIVHSFAPSLYVKQFSVARHIHKWVQFYNLRKPGSAILDIISSVISYEISYIITSEMVLRRWFRTKLPPKCHFRGNYLPLKLPPQWYFGGNYVQNHLRSTISEVITYKISCEITDEMMSEMALPDFHNNPDCWCRM